MTKPTLLITRGVPGSGKTTWALQWMQSHPDWVRVNRDDIREELYGKDYEPAADKEQRVTHYHHTRISEALAAGKNVINDDTNLNNRFLPTLVALAREHNARFAHKDFPISYEEALRRNAARERVVPEYVIERMYKGLGLDGNFHHIDGTYPLKPRFLPTSRQHAVGFDMDGTLADTRPIQKYLYPGLDKKGRQIKDFDSFHRNSLFVPANEQVLQMAMDAHEAGLKVIITTARTEKYREVTQLWLDRMGVPYENLFMRHDGDMRPDYQIKIDLLKQEILPIYDVVRFADDNPQAVQAWVDNDIPVTVVPGWDNPVPMDQTIQIDNVLRRGGCIRCGKKLKNGGILGPDCAKLR